MIRHRAIMPPFNLSDLYSAQNATGSGSVPANSTYRELDPPQQLSAPCTDASAAHDAFSQEVSWQSAYWPVMACMLAVLLQETGRVMEAPFWLSYTIRACPVICVFDTFMMLLKFLVMLAVGCSPRTAARHVWYDRFDQDLDDATTEGLVEFWSPFFSTASDTTIEAVPSSNPHAYSDHDGDEYMCSGALPVGSIQEHG